MKNILIVMNTMGRAGAEKALISLLRALDYSRVSVSLLSVIDRGEMFSELPPEVHVLNKKPSVLPVLGIKGSLYIAGKVLARMLRGGFIFRYIPYAVKNILLQLHAGRFQPDKLLWLLLARTTPAPEAEYDLAIAFLEGAATYYVAEKARARQKLSFVHVNFEKAGYIKQLDLPFYEKMDYICCVSEPLKRALDESVFPELAHKTRIFPNIISPKEILASSLAPGGFQDGFTGLRIVTVARLHPQKGLDVAIKAFSNLVEAGCRNARWYVLGDGTERTGLLRLIDKYNLRDKFILLGSRDNPYPYILQADIYVQPSRFEGLGLSLLEAIVLGKPCVTTDFDGLPSLLHHGEDALIIKLSEENIATALKSLMDSRELRETLSEGAKRVQFDFPDKTHMLYSIMDGKYWEE